MAVEVKEGESFLEKDQISRISFEPKLKRIDFCDKRVYRRSEDVYYPSVTSVLNCLPSDPFFLDWLKTSGHNADIVRDRAAREGTQVHNAIEELLAGHNVEWVDNWGKAKYGLQVWQMILKFVDFYNTVGPETIASEKFIWSDKYRYAGAADYVCKIDGETWLIDFKTSNQLSKSYDLQLAAYAKALEECANIHIDKAGILWLKAATRKASKKSGVYQGEGWQIKVVEDLEKDFKAFQNVYSIFEMYNPTVEPYTKTYPTEITLN